MSGNDRAPDGGLILAPDGVSGPYIIDNAGLLTSDQRARLEDLSAQITAEFPINVYVLTVDDYRDINSGSVFEAAELFAKYETILPAPESSHAIRAAIDEALKCKETGEAKTILFNLSGHGFVDMAAYDQYFSGEMTNYRPTDEELAKYIASADALNK